MKTILTILLIAALSAPAVADISSLPTWEQAEREQVAVVVVPVYSGSVSVPSGGAFNAVVPLALGNGSSSADIDFGVTNSGAWTFGTGGFHVGGEIFGGPANLGNIPIMVGTPSTDSSTAIIRWYTSTGTAQLFQSVNANAINGVYPAAIGVYTTSQLLTLDGSGNMALAGHASAAGTILAGNYAGGSSAGDLGASQSATVGAVRLGGATHDGSIFYGYPTGQEFAFYSDSTLLATLNSSGQLNLPSLGASEPLCTDGSGNFSTTCTAGGAAYSVTLTLSGNCSNLTLCTLTSATPSGTPGGSPKGCTSQVNTTSSPPGVIVFTNHDAAGPGEEFSVFNVSGGTVTNATTYAVTGTCA